MNNVGCNKYRQMYCVTHTLFQSKDILMVNVLNINNIDNIPSEQDQLSVGAKQWQKGKKGKLTYRQQINWQGNQKTNIQTEK